MKHMFIGQAEIHLDPNEEIKEFQPDFAKDIWNGKNGVEGLRQTCLDMMKASEGPNDDKELRQAVIDLMINSEKQKLVALRFNHVLGYVATKGSLEGVPSIPFSSHERQYLARVAVRLETTGAKYLTQIEQQIRQQYPNDPERADLIFQRAKQIYLQSEVDALDSLVRQRVQLGVNKVYREQSRQPVPERLPAPQPAADQAPIAKYMPKPAESARQNQDWAEAGRRWAADSPFVREDRLKKIREKFPFIYDSWSARLRGQPYYYFEITAVDKEESNRVKVNVNTANDAQQNLINALDRYRGGAAAVRGTPTGELRNRFKDLDLIAKEVKIHFMPKTQDEPLVVHRLLQFINDNPQFRDCISNFKIRVEGNNGKDQSIMPEIVIYTDTEHQQQLLAALQAAFVDMKGSGRVPRFNQEVCNGLIYMAQSGGDLKEVLGKRGTLDKLFDKKANHAVLRV